MNDKVEVAVRVEPLPGPGDPQITYCVPTDIRNMATILETAYDLVDLVYLHKLLAEGITRALLEEYPGPANPLEIN
jgi:hypothetical protein